MRTIMAMGKSLCASMIGLLVLVFGINTPAWSNGKSSSQAADTSLVSAATEASPQAVTADTTSEDEFGFGEMSLPGLTLNELSIYGYFATRFEKTFAEPSLESKNIVKRDAPAEFLYPSFNLLLQHQISNKCKAFINLNGAGGEAVDLRNFWGEYSASAALNLRMGKIYRKFGLYNEILDAVPTYYGIEPPELFDADHLMISRTTALMLYGSISPPSGIFNYSVSTDNGEGGAAEGVVPLGYDVNYKFGGGDFTLGLSGYFSGGATTSDVVVGDGSPKSGVLPWMAADKFSVLGGYFEAKTGALTLQAEYWRASHNAKRDPEAVVAMIAGAAPNAAQLRRFLNNPGAAVEAGNVNVSAKYDIKTWYVRAGFSQETRAGEVAPYVQWDYYSNPETIAKKKFGGDNEAGVADDGVFNKSTVGIVFRPIPQVAAKLDQSFHFYKFNGEDVNYWEIRCDVSLLFGQVF
ncbi:hypothetical protein HUU05_03465 [candidate division KSB1 bacterium]|nr:hypothetical protein [candidate division KSB1 bacterium]